MADHPLYNNRVPRNLLHHRITLAHLCRRQASYASLLAPKHGNSLTPPPTFLTQSAQQTSGVDMILAFAHSRDSHWADLSSGSHRPSHVHRFYVSRKLHCRPGHLSPSTHKIGAARPSLKKYVCLRDIAVTLRRDHSPRLFPSRNTPFYKEKGQDTGSHRLTIAASIFRVLVDITKYIPSLPVLLCTRLFSRGHHDSGGVTYDSMMSNSVVWYAMY
ncbi:hypothetical protein V8E53_014456 [Lactarius tabidus]